mgnify:CR=1 FL=1
MIAPQDQAELGACELLHKLFWSGVLLVNDGTGIESFECKHRVVKGLRVGPTVLFSTSVVEEVWTPLPP